MPNSVAPWVYPLHLSVLLPALRRIDFPYHEGLTLTIRPHVPPPPFGLSGYTRGEGRKLAPEEEVAKFLKSEWCLRNPPAETHPHPDAAETQTLKIIQAIACKNGRGAQIVRCHLGDDDRSYVAKIYDPLYYPVAGPADVAYLADQDYSREAAAFEDLMAAGVDGQFTPKYYGSWTFHIPLPGTSELRPVRLVLLEWLDGVDLWSIMERDGRVNRGLHTIPPKERLEIFARAAEADMNVKFHGVLHRDFAPRNVMIVVSATDGSPTLRVVLIDFNRSICVNRPNYQNRQFYVQESLPVSPRYRWWGGCPNEFSQWVPDPHRSDAAVFNGWLVTRWPDPSSGYLLLPLDRRRQTYTVGLIEHASPVPDTKHVFAQVYRRHYELPPMSE
ncbi:hypothetical protein N0V84_007834 [Fusarium piperis]|uniref:non-specific serine/threonine protein kinase n=1 Tax=Fusarium piperis TaxID=1435070 RepID=A0A9W8W9D9_9HYPO|nr:hypothetical protein N0V84_007834 [Fusarium piperis]